MAKQAGHIFITGTIDDVTYYKMFGTYYARMKSTLSRKKVLTSPRFACTRMHANQLAEASRIASQLYRSIPKEKRNMQLFRTIVGQAKVLLAQGKEKEVVLGILTNEFNPQLKSTSSKKIIKGKENRAYVTKAGRLILKELNHPNPIMMQIKPSSLRFHNIKHPANAVSILTCPPVTPKFIMRGSTFRSAFR